MTTSLEIRGPDVAGQDRILTPDAIEFVEQLISRFGPRRDQLLARRQEVQARLAAGALPDFLDETADIRSAEWSVAP
ncbi:MAG: malate synthase A, partial [Gemmatimonadales bacterium]